MAMLLRRRKNVNFAKRFIAFVAVIAITIVPFASPYDVSAATQKDGYNIAISNVTVSPSQVNVGSLASLKFDYNIDTQSGNAMKPGDTIKLSTNIGTMFGNLQSSDVPLYLESGQKIATATITGTEIKFTLDSDFPADRNFMSGSLYTGARLKALDNGATAGNPVTKPLTVEDASTNVTFKVRDSVPGTNTGGVPGDPSLRTINNRLIEKQGWTSAYDTATIKLFSNQLGSLRLFNTYNNIDSTFGTYQEQTHMMIVDKIPRNGVVDLSTISFSAVRYNWTEVPASGNRFYTQAAPGTVMPYESGSNWIPVTEYFTQINQSSSDTYDSFYAKVKAQKLSYGVFKDPATGGDTFIANLSNDSLKYTDLEPSLAGINKIKDIYGNNGPSHGNVVTFFAEFDTHYPDITSLENVTNTGNAKSDQAEDSASASYTIDNANGTANVAAGNANIKVVDDIDGTTPIAGAEFKIQTKVGGNWADYYIRGRKATAKTNARGEATISGLSRGDYRLVQTSTPAKYTYTNKVFKTNTAIATAGSINATEGTFKIQNATQPGFAVIVPNYQTATAKLTGHKEYVDSEGTTLAIPENTFEVAVSQIAGENYDGVTMPDTTTTFVQNNGDIEFDKIKFTKVGTYKFKVKETGSNPVAGVAYDTAEKEVKVTVANDGGTLKATADSEPRFRNMFTSVKKNLRVKKTLSGDTPPAAGEFKFELSQAGTTALGLSEAPMPAGSVLGKKVVTVNGAGEIDFGDIEFKAVGKYTYKVVELDTGLTNYTYDKTEYTVVVDVTADANNQLVANYEIKKGAETVNDLTFNNKYEVPKVPTKGKVVKKHKSPKTGDSTGNLMLMISIFAASILMLIGTVGYKKRLR